MSDSPEINISQAAVPRRYDTWIGGKDNFQADRDSAKTFGELVPAIPAAAVENRRFLLRGVRYLFAERGIRQFLDLGCGIPHYPDVDSIAGDSRVVYVDNFPMVAVHMRALRARPPRVDVVEADLRRPATILTSPQLQATLDLSQPVAVLMSAVLHLIPDTDDPAELIRQYGAALAPDSHLLVSHGTLDGLAAPHRAALSGREHGPDPYCPRSRDQVARLFDGWELLDPGIVPTVRWHPGLDPAASNALSDAEAMCYAAVAVRR